MTIPLHSGYTFRALSILREQRALGWETFHITGSKQGNFSAPEEMVDGYRFFRTPVDTGLLGRLSILNQVAVINGLAKRL